LNFLRSEPGVEDNEKVEFEEEKSNVPFKKNENIYEDDVEQGLNHHSVIFLL